MTGASLGLRDFQSEIPLFWEITQTIHTLNASGYKTGIEASISQ